MRISKISLYVTMFVAIMAALPNAWAQREIQQIPPFVTYDGDNPDLTHPFVDPLAFDPDFQFFAPAEIGDYGGRPEAPTGWYGEYARMYLWISRPEGQASFADGDYTWGNRYDIGYMSDEDHGWNFSHMHVDGPTAFDEHIVERINRFNEDDEINGPVTTTGNQAADPVFPIVDRNNPITQSRDYIVSQSLNAGDLVGFELNKTFRIKPLHYGSVVEPLVGIRFNKFNNYFRRTQYNRFDEDTNGVVLPFPNAADFTAATIEQLTTFDATWTNQMVGGQLGLRWFTQKSRWNLSGEARFFALQNFQSYTATTYTERTYYDGQGTGTQPTGILSTRTGAGNNGADFVVGTDLRLQAAFQATRDIRVLGGMQLLDFGRGIMRSGAPTGQDEDIVMVGATMGFEINR